MERKRALWLSRFNSLFAGVYLSVGITYIGLGLGWASALWFVGSVLWMVASAYQLKAAWYWHERDLARIEVESVLGKY